MPDKKKILFYLGHPAHYHLFKHVIRATKSRGHEALVLCKTKDILEDLLKRDGMDYINILPEGRKDNKLSILWGMIKRNWRIGKLIRGQNIDMMFGTEAALAQVGWVLGIPSIMVQEDDSKAIPAFASLAYPFASHILAPTVCDVGRYQKKKIAYEGYHELAYLHPDNFVPDKSGIADKMDLSKPYFILRFAKLTAHHDVGRNGLDTEIVSKLVEKLVPHGNIYITSERELEPQFEKYRISIDPLDIHHALAYASLYIGDSQTMAAEAAVLGTPSIRFNDFVGELGYLEELEHKYQLTFGFRTNNPDNFLTKVDTILGDPQSLETWKKRKEKMLLEKVDLAALLLWFFENYPASIQGGKSKFSPN